MKQEEINKNNKLIAEFMGFYPPKGFIGKTLGYYIHKDELRYHTSWDWLMSVVEKISKIVGFKTIEECTNDEWFVTANLMQTTISTPIHIVYANVVLFINWYNKNK